MWKCTIILVSILILNDGLLSSHPNELEDFLPDDKSTKVAKFNISHANSNLINLSVDNKVGR